MQTTYEKPQNCSAMYKCTVCHILGFRYELWKSAVNLIKFLQIPECYNHHKQQNELVEN